MRILKPLRKKKWLKQVVNNIRNLEKKFQKKQSRKRINLLQNNFVISKPKFKLKSLNKKKN